MHFKYCISSMAEQCSGFGAGEGQEWWYAAERRPRRMLEAEPPAEVDWNTKFTGRFADWARPGDSRFVTPHDYAADLRHAER